jgi:hypothetical protein
VTITFTLPNIGLYEKAAALAQVLVSTPGSIGLFQNNYTPNDGTTLGNLTEATFGGYARQPITAATPSGSSAATLATISIAPVTFTSTVTAAQTIYGAFVALSTSSAGYDLVGVTNLEGGPQVLNSVGANIMAQLTITDTRAAGQP